MLPEWKAGNSGAREPFSKERLISGHAAWPALFPLSCSSRRPGDGETLPPQVIRTAHEWSERSLHEHPDCERLWDGPCWRRAGSGEVWKKLVRCERPPSPENQTLEGSAALARLPKEPSCVPTGEPVLGSPPFSRHAWPEKLKVEMITQKPAM